VTEGLAAAKAAISAIPDLAGRWTIEPLRGLTNRSYRLTRGTEALVLRLPGAGSAALVERKHEVRNHRIAASLGLAPPLVYGDGSGLLVTRFLDDASVLDPAGARNAAAIDAVAGLLAKLHKSQVRFEGRRDPFENLDSYLAEARDTELDRLRKAAEPARLALAASAEALAPCHIDPAPANLLRTSEGLRLIDWEYSAMAEPSWDLADFAAEADLDADQAARLLERYGRGRSARERARHWLWRLGLDLLAAAWARLRLAQAGPSALAGLLEKRSARAAAAIGSAEFSRMLAGLTAP